MSYAYASARPPLRRPRMLGESLILGQGIVLAQREVVNGCWMVRQLDTAVLAGSPMKSLSPPMIRRRAACCGPSGRCCATPCKPSGS